MNIPQPRWYRWIEKTLLRTDPIVKAVLLGVIAVSIVMLFLPSRAVRLLWTIYLIAP